MRASSSDNICVLCSGGKRGSVDLSEDAFVLALAALEACSLVVLADIEDGADSFAFVVLGEHNGGSCKQVAELEVAPESNLLPLPAEAKSSEM